MSIFTNLNKNFESPFTTVPADADYIKLGELDADDIHTMVSIFINTKSKFGEHPVAGIITADGEMYNLSLPKHLTSLAEEILGNEDMINAINDGECQFRVKECYSNKYNRDFRTIEFM